MKSIFLNYEQALIEASYGKTSQSCELFNVLALRRRASVETLRSYKYYGIWLKSVIAYFLQKTIIKKLNFRKKSILYFNPGFIPFVYIGVEANLSIIVIHLFFIKSDRYLIYSVHLQQKHCFYLKISHPPRFPLKIESL